MTPARIDTLTGERLAAACEAHGVYDGFFDIWGEHHPASDDLKRALLKILTNLQGHTSEPPEVDDSETILGLYDLCQIIDVHSSLEVNLSMRLNECEALHWRLQLENGEQAHGRFDKSKDPTGEWRTSGAPARLVPRGEPWRPRENADQRQHLCVVVDSLNGKALPLGYHELVLTVITDSEHAEAATVCCPIVVTPERCFGFIDKNGDQARKRWGLSSQLYSIRSNRNWGMGDFADLAQLIELAGSLGADAVGLNPLHTIQTLRPGLGSPYSPNSREFLNPLYLHLEHIPDFVQSKAAQSIVRKPVFQAALKRAQEAEFVDYDQIAKLKIPVLHAMFAHFKANCLDRATDPEAKQRAEAFRVFIRTHGDSLQQHATFEALQAHLAGVQIDDYQAYNTQGLAGWSVWPESFRSPNESQVIEFASHHRSDIEFYLYLQWCTSSQLSHCAALAQEHGVDCGLYLDLALGNDSGGAEVWASQADYAINASLGAPPDDLSPGGQDWGIIALNPAQLPNNAYQPFVRVLRAQMRSAGVLRIDHVMGLMRQFWTVSTASGLQGGYVSAPFEELLALVALESVRNQCVVIGEDLGTVPPEIRDKLREYGVLSYRVFYFEKHWEEDGRFKAPEEYPAQALAVASTHDLPTVLGFWQGIDIKARRQIGDADGGFPDTETEQRVTAERAADKERLLGTLGPYGIGSGGSNGAPPQGLADAVHRFLSQTPCQLTMVQLEDLLGVQEQANLPGTTIEHRNWCRKLPIPIEQWTCLDAFIQIAEIMQAR